MSGLRLIKKVKNIGLILLLVLVLFVGLNCFKYYKATKIDRILKTDSYSYLSEVVQDYVREVYEETGEVILTEKNKESNVPYLNPKYIAYLQLTDEQKKNVSVIPNVYNLDYVFSGNDVSSEDFPSSFNLENVDGKNFTSPMYNQGTLGTCWAFSTVQNAESFLMLQKNEPRNANSTRFSVRQFDYAASTDGIKNYENPWGVAPLTLGGNFVYATTLMANGVGLNPDSYMPYTETKNQKPLHEIFNLSNSLYELNSTVNLPNFGKVDLEYSKECEEVDDWEACYDQINAELFESYNSIIKEGIMNYGGIYTGAFDPTGPCGTLNTDGKYILEPSFTCMPMGSTVAAETGHALQIIGWDDNYQYSYCSKLKYESVNADGECDSGEKQTGKGAWLIKNSWGEDHDAAYFYMTYNSILLSTVDFAYITSLSEMKDRNWDNVYNSGLISSSFSSKITQSFENKHDNQEKIQKIKFHTMLMNQEISVSVKVGDNTYLITDSYKTKYPGLYTVDVSDKNITIDKGNFSVIITSSERAINNNSISVLTKSIDNSIQSIVTEEEINLDSNEFTIYSETRNIPSNSVITYELYKDTTKLEDTLVVSNNIVGANNINTDVTITKKLEVGTYRLVQKYGNAEVSTSLNVGVILDGAGTLENPFKIHNEEELKYIQTHLEYHYELVNDIELTENWTPIGTKDNPFSGAFNGNNYKIKNLNINDTTLEYAGLFGYIKDSSSHQTYIKNIYIDNPTITGGQYVGGLIGGINITQSGDNTSLIDSIYIIDGTISGTHASALVADISGSKKLTINNIFTSATIKGSSSSNVIRFSSNLYNVNVGTTVSNIQNIGILFDNYYTDDAKTSLMKANYSYYYKLFNYISTGYSKKIASKNMFYDIPIDNTDYLYVSKGYTLIRTNSIYEFPSNVGTVSDITELKNLSLYSTWGDDFSTYWTIKEIDGVTRIPLLKGVESEFKYTESIDDINIELGEDISLSDYISSSIIDRRLRVTTEDNDIISISEKYNYCEAYPYDIVITPLKSGSAILRVVSDYDGFEQNVTLTIISDEVKITYYNDSDTKVQTIKKNDFVNLIANPFEKEHYTFKEWNTKADGSGTKYNDEAQVLLTEDLDLYAQWIPCEYSITFVSNGGTGSMENQLYEYNVSGKLNKNTFEREYYTFKGWNTKADGSGTQYTNEQEITLSENIILYAQWKINEYTVTFDSNGGTGSMESQVYKYNVSGKLNKNTFEREYYTFNGWNTKADGSGTQYTNEQEITLSENIILYAQWKVNEYTVTFDSNGGTGSMESQVYKYNVSGKLNKNTFEREYYTFNGWNTKADGSGTQYTNEQEITLSENIILYAQWEIIKHSVTFDANGGKFANNNVSITVDEWDDSKLQTLEKPTRDGYTFKGYFTEKTGGTSLESYIAEAGIDKDGLVFYAQWESTFTYEINDYVVDEDKLFIDDIPVNTTLDDYLKKIKLGKNYKVEVGIEDGKNISTGSKTKILKGNDVVAEYVNIVRGEVTGDGVLNYLDYVNLYNHIYKTKNPDSDRKLLVGPYLRAADMASDNTINYLDYVMIYNKIQDLKGGK